MTGALRIPASAPFPPQAIEALNDALAEAGAAQRQWLSGFLAGVEAATAAPGADATAPAPEPAAAIPLLVLYASESGNAEGIAYEAKKRAARRGFAARVADMAELSPADAAAAGNLLVVAATWGEGDPPERATEFYAALMAEDAPRFDGVRFAVLALGDTAYAGFCETGRRIDDRLADLGGIRAAARVDCDLDYEAPADAWLDGTLEAVREQAGPPAPAARPATVVHVDFKPGPGETGAAAWTKAAPFQAEIGELLTLTSSRSTKQTLHVELSLAGSGIAWEPGDSLGVVPSNDPAVVDAVLNAAGLAGDAALREELTERREVTVLTLPVVERYAALTGEPALRRLLDGGKARGFVEDRHVIDLLEEFPHPLAPESLTGLLRPLPPRLYSIASSRRATPDEAHLLVSAVRYRTNGRDRAGVVSTALADRHKPGDRLPVYLKPNRHFRLPQDGDRPIVMIGPGTGVAPFRAFVQEREAAGAKGASWLFFGDRNFTHDFLYQLEWQDHLKSGALTRLDLAFSRDQPEKVYVHHRMWAERVRLADWIANGAHLYVCGDEKHMAKDVHAMLVLVLMDRHRIDQEAAESILSDLKRQGRYQRDIY